MPARQAFLIQMVEGREDLTNAIGLNSSMFNGPGSIGPAIAGFTIEFTGEGICFLLNGLSYLAVLAGLFAMRLKPPRTGCPAGHVAHRAVGRPSLRLHFPADPRNPSSLVFVNLASIPLTNVLLPIYAKSCSRAGRNARPAELRRWARGPAEERFRLAFRKSVLGLGRQIAWSAGLFRLGPGRRSRSRPSCGSPWSCWRLAGLCVMLCTASSNTVVQTIVDDPSAAG